jgi:DNA-binding NtrC family response regulator
MFLQGSLFSVTVEQKALLLATTDQTLLIWGEAGTGKEKLALFIHRRSLRAEHPFTIVEMEQLPRWVMPYHDWIRGLGSAVEGAGDTENPMEKANGGTVCINHVDHRSDWHQRFLLSFLNNPFWRDKDGREHRLDIRIVLLAETDLSEAVRQGWFRKDLYFRLGPFNLYLPPLRRRDPEELRRIMRRLLRICPHAANEPNSDVLSDRVIAMISRYHWPGNVRELKSLLADIELADCDANCLERRIMRRMSHFTGGCDDRPTGQRLEGSA